MRRRPALVALFGVGLIGSALAEALRARVGWRGRPRPLGWSDEARRRIELRAVEEEIRARVTGGSEPAVARVEIVWSAGRAGFGATEAEVASESRAYRAVLELAARLAEIRPRARVTFHLVSSAGGLYEGQRLVDRRSEPAPRRPYGRLKLEQERRLLALEGALGRRIYRLTSTYGDLRPGHRQGLITALIANGLNRRVSQIFGQGHTLRDYLWVEDAARFLAARMLADRDASGTRPEFLVSARPASILEIKNLVEQTLGRRLLVNYLADRWNQSDITYSQRLVPEGLTITDPRCSVRAIYRRAMASGGGQPGAGAA